VEFHNKYNDILFSIFNCISPVIKSCVSPMMDCSVRNMNPFRVKFFFVLKIFYLLNDYGLFLSVTFHQCSIHIHSYVTDSIYIK